MDPAPSSKPRRVGSDATAVTVPPESTAQSRSPEQILQFLDKGVNGTLSEAEFRNLDSA